jgi:hypothetical protein
MVGKVGMARLKCRVGVRGVRGVVGVVGLVGKVGRVGWQAWYESEEQVGW